MCVITQTAFAFIESNTTIICDRNRHNEPRFFKRKVQINRSIHFHCKQLENPQIQIQQPN